MQNFVELIEHLKIIPVVAIRSAEDAEPLADALSEGNLPIAEITLRTEAGIDAIETLSTRAEFTVGAGTVHSVEQAKQVADAGAKFVVAPGFNPRTVEWCLDNGMPIFPGVASPTDLEMALEYGLHVVKFFPAELIGGVAMIKALQGPYSDIRFIPTGGIHIANLCNYLRLPAVVACGGSWMVAADIMNAGRFDEVKRLSAEAVALAHSF